MRNNSVCIFIAGLAAVLCLTAALCVVTPRALGTETAALETVEAEAAETAGVPPAEQEPWPAINQKGVEPVELSPKEEFYLVSETGYLLVFAQDQSTICLYTHIPITEFPEKEQEKLRSGIWFSSMMEIFHYLESYTS